MLLAASLLWSLTPCLALWLGLYVLKSAVWTFVLYHGVCLLPVVILKKSVWLPTAKAPELKHCLALLVVAVLFSFIAWGGYKLFGHQVLNKDNIALLLRSLGYCKQRLLPLSIYIVVVNPLIEEIYWRGIVLNQLEEQVKNFKSFGLLWSSGAYALFHFMIVRMVVFPVPAVVGTIMLAFYGALMAFIYRKTGSIITTGIAHGILSDMAAVVLVIDLVRHHPELL